MQSADVNDASYTCIYEGRPTERCIWSNMSCLIVLRNSKFGTRAIAAVVSSPIHLIVVKRHFSLQILVQQGPGQEVPSVASCRMLSAYGLVQVARDLVSCNSACQRRSTTSRNHTCRFRHLQLSRYPTRKRIPMTTYAG